MNIRIKLTLQFTLIVTIILVIFTLGIHYFSTSYRENEFDSRLRDKLLTTAKLLIDVKDFDNNLLRIIDKNSLSLHDENIIVLNEKNKIIYFSTDTLHEKPSPLLLKNIRKKGSFDFTNGLREGIGMTYKCKKKEYIIIAIAFDKDGIMKMRNLQYTLIFGLILGVLASFIIGYFFANRALSPIHVIVKKVNRISASSLNLRLNEGNGNDEIAQLSKTFNAMLERIENSFVLQRDFVANASHELRTPVTIIIAEIEYLLMQSRSSEEYRKSLTTISDDLKSFNETLNALFYLTLTSLEKRNFERTYLRVDELLIVARNEIIKSHSEYNIDLDFSKLPDDDSQLIILGNENLLKIAFKNLIDNGCKYSSNKTIHVSLNFTNAIHIEFKDQGIGIKSEDLDLIFQPFYRVARTANGHGLGLPLVKRIIDLHDGSISVVSEIMNGSIFTVEFSFLQT